MKSRAMEKGSLVNGRLPKGCALCGRGSKMVLLVTGLCGSGCYYCPLSAKKRGRDVVYANELMAGKWRDVIREAELIGAEGAGFTGGDPLRVTARACRYARALKKRFGGDFHIHLYTSGTDPAKIKSLAAAGVDEFRFHPPPKCWGSLGSTGYPPAIRAAARAGADVGVEVPVIPGMAREAGALLESLKDTDVSFVNLNELEFSETNWRALKGRGFSVKDDVSSGVSGSELLARRLVLGWRGPFSLHYCSASYKDAVQLRKRLLRRAERVAAPGDVVTRDGTLLKGIIETRNPAAMKRDIAARFSVSPELMRLDSGKRRLEVALWVLDDIADCIDADSFAIEEYPTSDRLEVERTPLKRRRR